MQMRSRKWLKNTGAAVSVLAVLLLGGNALAQSTPEQVANDLYRQIYGKYGTAGALTQNAIIPMSTHTRMTTVDGSIAFYTDNMNCPSSKQFLTIGVLPLSSGDLDRVIISEDLDTDGTPEYSYVTPYVVSGVCVNGFVSCDVGTWNNCRNFKWTADGGGRISTASTTSDALGSCYCINNNCGPNIVMTQLPYILYSLGSAVVGALQKVAVGKYAISDGVVNGMMITYTAQSTGDCADRGNMNSIGVDLASISALTSLFGNPGAIPGLADQARTSAAANPNSPYNAIVNSVSMQEKQNTVNDCSIIRSGRMDVKTEDPYFVWLPWLQVSIQCLWGTGCANCTMATQADTNEDGLMDTTQSSSYSTCDWSKSGHAATADSGIASMQQAYSIPFNWTQKTPGSESYSFTDGGGKGNGGNVTTYGIQVKKITTPVCPDGTVLNPVDIKCYRESLAETMGDSCSGMVTDPNCNLREETIDGVKTVVNGTPTYLLPASSCRTVAGVMTTQELCRGWWRKDRTYWCTGSTKYDLSFAMERAGTVMTSATREGDTLAYTDVKMNYAGERTYSNDTVLLNYLNGGSGCVIACKTQKPAMDTNATDQINAATVLSSNASYDYYYKECIDNACPVDSESGEVIITDCSCMNDAGEVIAIMEVMNAAGKDLICSSGTRY